MTVGSGGVEGYTLVDGMLRHLGRIVIGNNEDLKKKILQSPLGGHFRIQNTYLRVKQLFHWPGLRTEVRKFVLGCDICRRCKTKNVAYLGLLEPLPVLE